MEQGTASPDQQKIALNFIIDDLAALYDDPFCGDERETSYAQGRMYVGRELRKIIVRPFDRLTSRKTTE